MTNFTNDRAELETFKQFPIHDILPQLGWSLEEGGKNRGKDSFGFTNGSDTISTFKGRSCWMAKNFTTGKCSTVVDFALDASDGNMGQARKLLRELTGSSSPSDTTTQSTTSPAISSSTRPDKSEFKLISYASKEQVSLEYLGGATTWRVGDRLPDFLKDRGIRDPGDQFSGTFSVDNGRWQNVRFPYDAFDGNLLMICGVENKNHDFKGYTEGGKAGLWVARGDDCAPWIVCESPIDAMSFDAMSTYAQRNSRNGIRLNYVALRSGAEDMLVDFLKFEHKVRKFEQLIIATDNDAAGALYANKVMAGMSKVDGLTMRMNMPAMAFTDWNEALMRKRETELPETSQSISQKQVPAPNPAPEYACAM